jgi:DNA-binding transcriptional LysR family regulator
MFNWDDLRSFIEVTRTKSLSGAAGKLGVNHTTVARRIQSLEDSLAVQLFDKTPAGYVLTEAGSQLLNLAEQIETTAISAQELVAAQNPKLTGTVRLSVPEGFGSHFLVQRLGDFYKRYPGIDLEVVALPQTLSISKREADIAVTLFQPESGRLVISPLTDYTLRLYGTRAYLKRSPPVRRLDDLRKHRLVGYIEDSVDTPHHRCMSKLLPDAHVSLKVKSANAQLAAVDSELGIGLLSCYMAASRKDLTPVAKSEATLTRTFWISMHEDMRDVRRVTVTWDWLKETVAKHQDIFMGR